MKLLLISTLTIVLASCGYMGNKALDYNNSLVKKQYDVSEDMNAFMDFIKISRMDSISDINSYKNELNSLRDKALNNIKECQDEIRAVGSFKDDANFQQSLLNVMELYHQGINYDYYQMGAYYLLPKEEQTTEKYNEIVTLVLAMDNKVETAELNFIEEQKKFGLKYDVALSEN